MNLLLQAANKITKKKKTIQSKQFRSDIYQDFMWLRVTTQTIVVKIIFNIADTSYTDSKKLSLTKTIKKYKFIY